jgi:hypothetical protein
LLASRQNAALHEIEIALKAGLLSATPVQKVIKR